MSGGRGPATLRVMRTGHGSLSRASAEYLGWPLGIIITPTVYGVTIRAATDADHRPYRVSAVDVDSPGSEMSNFAARAPLADGGLVCTEGHRKYRALFTLDDDGETPVLMIRRCDRVHITTPAKRKAGAEA